MSKLEQIFKQVTVVSSPFSKELFIDNLTSILSSKIFEELINKEKEHIKITIIMEVKE